MTFYVNKFFTIYCKPDLFLYLGAKNLFYQKVIAEEHTVILAQKKKETLLKVGADCSTRMLHKTRFLYSLWLVRIASVPNLCPTRILDFYMPVLDGIMVQPRPSACPGLVGQTISSRILLLGTFDQHEERKMQCFQGRRSRWYCHIHVVEKCCRQDTN